MPPRSKRKVKHDPVAKLKVKLWRKYFSPYIRLRDSDENGICTCFTCGAKSHYKNMDAGHFFEKSVCTLPGYFSEAGVNAQCTRCNMHMSGNKDEYAVRLIQTYGTGIIEELDAERKTQVQNASNWLLEQIEHYSEKLRVQLNQLNEE